MNDHHCHRTATTAATTSTTTRTKMTPLTLLVLSLTTPTLCNASMLNHGDSLWSWLPWHAARPLDKRAEGIPEEGYWNPLEYGGDMFTIAQNSWPENSGEPINVIISGNSDSRVLVDSEADGGLRNYFTSFDFSGECLGQHQGTPQTADLGDGDGRLGENAVIRYNYQDPQLGTCKETIEGGNHFRYWVQDGPERNSQAVFCAFAYEKSVKENHNPIFNGYNLGRDWAIGNISSTPIPTESLTNQSTYTGHTSFNGYTYQTDIKYVSGLLPNSSENVNHNWSVSIPSEGINAADGLVAVFSVYIIGTPDDGSNGAGNGKRVGCSTGVVVGLLGGLLVMGWLL